MIDPQALIADLDDALKDGEEFVLRRVTGSGDSAVNTDVTCLGRIDAVTTEDIAAGFKATDLNVILSPTQINNAGWPGASPGPGIDPRVPLANGPDKAIIRGYTRQILFPKPFYVAGTLVRLELKVSG